MQDVSACHHGRVCEEEEGAELGRSAAEADAAEADAGVGDVLTGAVWLLAGEGDTEMEEEEAGNVYIVCNGNECRYAWCFGGVCNRCTCSIASPGVLGERWEREMDSSRGDTDTELALLVNTIDSCGELFVRLCGV